MQFTPKTEEQLAAENLLAEGKYPFQILEAEERSDSKNRPFFRVKVNVFDRDGRGWGVFDNISPSWMAHKLRHFCYAAGLQTKYEAGALTKHDLIGREGYCDIGIEPANGKYGPKNVINDYVTQEEASGPATNPADPDDIGF